MQINRCMSCMNEISGFPCRHCGYYPGQKPTPEEALREGNILNGRYLLGRMLGRGGFGITYVGFDLASNTKVAIKEYFPANQARRMGQTLKWITSQSADTQSGLEAFVSEAQKMDQVGHIPEVVKVSDLFQENNTAYIVMEYIEGITLKEWLDKNGPLSWGQAETIFYPVLTGMAGVHMQGLIHRDVSPDNIMIQNGGAVRILDLGAAKNLNISSGPSSVLVAKSGFSPMEQYLQRGSSGPWTDVYALAATMYYALTLNLPPSSVDRMNSDTLDFSLPEFRKVPPRAIAAMKHAFAIQIKNRTPSMEIFLQELGLRPPRPAQKSRSQQPAGQQVQNSAQPEAVRVDPPAPEPKPKPKLLIPLLIVTGVLLAVAAVTILALNGLGS